MDNVTLQKENLEALEEEFQSCPGDCDTCLKVATCLRVYASLDKMKRRKDDPTISRWFRNNMNFLFGTYL